MSGPVSFAVFFAVLLFLGSLFETFFGSELLFLGGGAGLVFFGGFLPMFLFYFSGGSLPKLFRKILLMSGLVFLVDSFSLPLVFSSTPFSPFFLCFKRYSSGSNRTPPHAPFCLFLFSFCVPPRLLFRPFWPCVPLLGVFSGCHSGPRAFLGFSLDLSETFFLGREAARVFGASLVLVFLFPPCVLFCGHTFS